MQAEGIRTGDRCDVYDDRGQVLAGWTATGDAETRPSDEHGRDMVFVPVHTHHWREEGHDDTAVFEIGEQVPLSWGSGSEAVIQPRFPEGTPEYAAYAAELREELAKFVAHEPPYDVDELSRGRQVGRLKP